MNFKLVICFALITVESTVVFCQLANETNDQVRVDLINFLSRLICKFYQKAGPLEISPITLPALGRIVNLGEFYDARTDQFSKVSIFNQELTKATFHSTETGGADLRFTTSDTYEEKFNQLDVQGSAKLNIILDSFGGGTGASARYFKARKTSAKSAKEV